MQTYTYHVLVAFVVSVLTTTVVQAVTVPTSSLERSPALSKRMVFWSPDLDGSIRNQLLSIPAALHSQPLSINIEKPIGDAGTAFTGVNMNLGELAKPGVAEYLRSLIRPSFGPEHSQAAPRPVEFPGNGESLPNRIDLTPEEINQWKAKAAQNRENEQAGLQAQYNVNPFVHGNGFPPIHGQGQQGGGGFFTFPAIQSHGWQPWMGHPFPPTQPINIYMQHPVFSQFQHYPGFIPGVVKHALAAEPSPQQIYEAMAASRPTRVNMRLPLGNDGSHVSLDASLTPQARQIIQDMQYAANPARQVVQDLEHIANPENKAIGPEHIRLIEAGYWNQMDKMTESLDGMVSSGEISKEVADKAKSDIQIISQEFQKNMEELAKSGPVYPPQLGEAFQGIEAKLKDVVAMLTKAAEEAQPSAPPLPTGAQEGTRTRPDLTKRHVAVASGADRMVKVPLRKRGYSDFITTLLSHANPTDLVSPLGTPSRYSDVAAIGDASTRSLGSRWAGLTPSAFHQKAIEDSYKAQSAIIRGSFDPFTDQEKEALARLSREDAAAIKEAVLQDARSVNNPIIKQALSKPTPLTFAQSAKIDAALADEVTRGYPLIGSWRKNIPTRPMVTINVDPNRTPPQWRHIEESGYESDEGAALVRRPAKDRIGSARTLNRAESLSIPRSARFDVSDSESESELRGRLTRTRSRPRQTVRLQSLLTRYRPSFRRRYRQLSPTSSQNQPPMIAV